MAVVPNKQNKIRMCIDFKNLNKASLKDSLLICKIDRIFHDTTRHEIISFLNAYYRYNLIYMDPKYWEKPLLSLNMERIVTI